MIDREPVDCVVIGAGVVGLAVARALALTGREVIVLEAAATIGTETSSRNSEVIHAGIYYPQGSLKAKTCVAGKLALYDYCDNRHVEYRRCGKLIVATGDAQLATLEEIRARAAANGVDDLVPLTPSEAREMEPAVYCVGALLSPSTGIIDSHGLMLAYQGDAENAGALFAFRSPVSGGEILDNGIAVDVASDDGDTHLLADIVVNASGLRAAHTASLLRGLPPSMVPPYYFAKGNYYTLPGRSPFNRLIYPVPEQAGLGVHVTIDLGGQARFGPDVEWLPGDGAECDVTREFDYDVDPRRADVFYGAVRRYWPGLPDGALVPGYAGIRPKLQAPGEPAADFVIQGPAEHGVPGLINMYGIESPGLTASLALAEQVLGQLAR